MTFHFLPNFLPRAVVLGLARPRYTVHADPLFDCRSHEVRRSSTGPTGELPSHTDKLASGTSRRGLASKVSARGLER